MLDKAHTIAGELVRLRRDIHQHPELSFQEFRTAALVADTLHEIGGIQVKTGVGRTGVVGELGSGHGPTLAIRADMDALPIVEKTDLPYRSQNRGVMHACGHDAHTAILLGAAHLLRQSLAEDKWQGQVRLLFQPSEEAHDDDGTSGATAMIDDGALEGVDAVISLHVISHLAAGMCYFQDGYSLAAVDSFDAWVRGMGGHGAYPHEGSDPLFMLVPILSALYAVPSRRIDPVERCVVSLGAIHGGTTTNVIPSEVHLRGTIRSHKEAVRHQLWQEVENCLRMAELMGGSYELKIHPGYPAMYNDAGVNQWLRQTAGDLLGEGVTAEMEFGMGAEDFAYMTARAKGAMFFLGAAVPDGVLRNHHTDIFDIDEAVLPVGAAILAETARRFVTGQLRPG
ncbi:MAG: amidohydrolase [Chloroflexota bacterium]